MKRNELEIYDETFIIAKTASIKIHCFKRHINGAMKAWNYIIKHSTLKDKLKQRHYYPIICILVQSRYPQQAFEIFETMIQNNIKPHQASYNIIVLISN